MKKDEEKTGKKQGEKGTNKFRRNHERHIDLTGRSEFVCTVPWQDRSTDPYTPAVWRDTEEPEGAGGGRDIQAGIV